MIGISTPVVFVAVCAGLGALALTRLLSVGHWAAVALFSLYLVGVAHFALLPLRFNPELAREIGPLDLSSLIELRPFFLSGSVGMPASQVLLNVLMTVPFGFGLPFVRRLRGREVLAIGFAFCLAIELSQLVADATSLALPTWSVDINDVLFNMLGVALGYAAFLIGRAIYSVLLGGLPLRQGVWSHFHDVLSS